MTAKEFDKIVCDWTLRKGVALREDQLNDLLDALTRATEPLNDVVGAAKHLLYGWPEKSNPGQLKWIGNGKSTQLVGQTPQTSQRMKVLKAKLAALAEAEKESG